MAFRVMLLIRAPIVSSIPFVILLGVASNWNAVCRADGPAINEMCPVMPAEKADPAIIVEFNGKTIAFCCDKCVRKFNAEPLRYASRLPGLMAPDPGSAIALPPSPPTSSVGESGTTLTLTSIKETPPPLFARFHPMLVHFPLAGFPLALLGLLVYRIWGNPSFAGADLPPLLAATAASILAVLSGNLAEKTQRFSESLQSYVEWHQRAGITFMVLGILLSTFRLWRWRNMDGRWASFYLGALVLACGFAALTGYLGGSIVFGPDHLKF